MFDWIIMNIIKMFPIILFITNTVIPVLVPNLPSRFFIYFIYLNCRFTMTSSYYVWSKFTYGGLADHMIVVIQDYPAIKCILILIQNFNDQFLN